MRASELHFDVVVIGAGTAGLTAAARLAQSGARVALVARGHGSTHLAPATLDVGGYLPASANGRRRVAVSGREGFEALATAHPGHPYAKLSWVELEDAVGWFTQTVSDGPYAGYEYVGSLDSNVRLPTAVGALRPSGLVPNTMLAGDSSRLKQVAVVGTPWLRDFHPALCAGSLREAGIDARPVLVDLDLEKADASCLTLAHHLDRPDWRAQFCNRLKPLLGDAEFVGLPAMLGVLDPFAVWTDVQQRLGREVFEIPMLPPSVPGMRLYEILRSAVRRAGARIAMGAEIHAHKRDGERMLSVTAHTAGHDLSYAADWFVLASGGFAAGAIELDADWQTHELVMDLPLAGIPGPGEARFLADYEAEQPMTRAGVATDANFVAEGTSNVLVAGASLAGAAAWQEGSGEGIALATASKAARFISEQRPAMSIVQDPTDGSQLASDDTEAAR